VDTSDTVRAAIRDTARYIQAARVIEGTDTMGARAHRRSALRTAKTAATPDFPAKKIWELACVAAADDSTNSLSVSFEVRHTTYSMTNLVSALSHAVTVENWNPFKPTTRAGLTTVLTGIVERRGTDTLVNEPHGSQVPEHAYDQLAILVLKHFPEFRDDLPNNVYDEDEDDADIAAAA
jgi:hypothetical protein